jgi:CBS domain-containing protein
MARSVGDIMTHDPRTVDAGDTLVDAAKAMAEADIGSVVVVDEGGVAGADHRPRHRRAGDRRGP